MRIKGLFRISGPKIRKNTIFLLERNLKNLRLANLNRKKVYIDLRCFLNIYFSAQSIYFQTIWTDR
jgi:hypothetical protein